ncbi:MAG: hypothetical protein WB630_16070 [Candidatus Acidiferrales bacterium]
MPDDSSERILRAQSASTMELNSLIHESDEEILVALLENPNIAEPHIVQMLERLDLSVQILTAIAEKAKWNTSEVVRVGLARHPKTPRRLALAILRQLYVFDLVRLSLLPSAPAEIRRIAEEVLITRAPHLPAGEKLTLARRGPARVVGALLAEGHPQAVKLALANAFLTESQILKVLANPSVPERVVTAIAQHPRWSVQHNIRLALTRNAYAPAPKALEFICGFTLRDLQDLAAQPDLPAHVARYIQKELSRRSGDSRPQH